jgi:hypothetical protein
MVRTSPLRLVLLGLLVGDDLSRRSRARRPPSRPGGVARRRRRPRSRAAPSAPGSGRSWRCSRSSRKRGIEGCSSAPFGYPGSSPANIGEGIRRNDSLSAAWLLSLLPDMARLKVPAGWASFVSSPFSWLARN